MGKVLTMTKGLATMATVDNQVPSFACMLKYLASKMNMAYYELAGGIENGSIKLDPADVKEAGLSCISAKKFQTVEALSKRVKKARKNIPKGVSPLYEKIKAIKFNQPIPTYAIAKTPEERKAKAKEYREKRKAKIVSGEILPPAVKG